MSVHLLKYEYWQNGCGKYYCGDTAAVETKVNKWWIPARLLNLSIERYLALLVACFNAKILGYKNDTLIYCFETENDADKFCQYINKKARLGKFYF